MPYLISDTSFADPITCFCKVRLSLLTQVHRQIYIGLFVGPTFLFLFSLGAIISLVVFNSDGVKYSHTYTLIMIVNFDIFQLFDTIT